MKKFIIAIVVIAALLAAAILFLQLTMPHRSAGVRFPLTPAQTELLAMVPASAESFALIPTAAAVYAELRANPVTSDAVVQWADDERLPQPWMLGGADLLIWRSGGRSSYAIRLDAGRAALMRVYRILGGNMDVRWSGTTFLINAPAQSPIDSAEMLRILAAGSALPPGDAFAAQRENDRSAFPPLRRPAVTSIRISAEEIAITSHAPARPDTAARLLNARYPRSALLAAIFARPPRVFDDLNRLLLTRVTPLVSDGGGVAIYDVDTGTLLPRPKGVIFLPADEPRREALERIVRDTAGYVQTAEQNDELLVSFDTSSIGRFTSDSFDPPRWPANMWSARLDPQRLVPILKRVGGSVGLRLAAPRLHRAARELGTWIGPLQQARAIEAAASTSGGTEELRVLVTSK